MTGNGYNAYQNVQRQTSPPRKTEARVLNAGALRLEKCRDGWNEEGREELLKEALHFNQRVWTILQKAVVDPTCPLPMELRINILKISAFIDKQIFKAMAHPSPEVLAPIIEINRGLAKGLEADPKRSSAASVVEGE